MPAVERPVLAGESRKARRGHDLVRLGHAADAGLAGLGHLAGVRTDHGTPSAISRERLRRVAGCCHMRGFIAGAINTGRSVASSTAEARSSAWPPAILAMRSAVAGATDYQIGFAR